ncbi:hypothetical protein GH723_13450 [Actinomarinicola tropica]|uniref:Uncharacterized protein n=1 Tax=Actinomarinicola tropica TaxID=2789776 RepID=A0A5Q2RN61_9ACTN|nr:hypothetical protein GH723_13450 [Actinomarinicola tropica]
MLWLDRSIVLRASSLLLALLVLLLWFLQVGDNPGWISAFVVAVGLAVVASTAKGVLRPPLQLQEIGGGLYEVRAATRWATSRRRKVDVRDSDFSITGPSPFGSPGHLLGGSDPLLRRVSRIIGLWELGLRQGPEYLYIGGSRTDLEETKAQLLRAAERP